MQATNVEALERTIHQTNEWLKDVQARLGAEDRRLAYVALRATLHALRDRLPIDEAAHLGAQLPALVRGVYYEGWKPSATPSRLRSADEFLGVVAVEANHPSIDPASAVPAVLAVLSEHVSGGEMADVRACLPQAIRALFPAPV